MGALFPAQTYAFSGRQWGSSAQTQINDKRPTDASPMVITSQPPGAFAKNDSDWKLTFGASHDAWLSLFNSAFMANSEPTLSEGTVYGKAMPTANFENLYKNVGDIQQVTYVVNKNTVAEFRDNPKLDNEFAARGLGLRFPTMAAGYGKTIALRPTDPNPQDKRLNDDEHKTARETWKHGPIFGRWDSRLGGWNTFNDLITGQHQDNLGTIVFGTNPDNACGFPFLKGKITDVWWVRKTWDYKDTTGSDDDFTQSAEVLNRLSAKYFDEETLACAPLNSILKVPTGNSCHPSANRTVTCGSETTHDENLIDIRTTAHFWMSDDKDGPFNFSATDVPSELICEPEAGFYHRGTIYFNDENCVWDVAVKLDECELAGGHLINLAANDVVIAERLTYICNFITNWAGGLGAVKIHDGVYSAPDVHDLNVAALNAGILCVDGNTSIALNTATQRAIQMDASVYTAAVTYVETAFNFMLEAVNNWITGALRPVLTSCCGEEAGSISTISAELVGAPSVPLISLTPPEFNDCNVALLPMPRLNCEYCFGVHLNVPCGETPNVFAGDACFTNRPPAPTTAFGNCQAHD